MEKKKSFFQKYSHAWVFLYACIYLPWFIWLEHRPMPTIYFIHTNIDQYIPFVEFFIIPYLSWFLYIPAVILYFFFKAPKKEFYQLVIFLFSGMTIFLIISTLYPNGLHLRPMDFPRDNFCSKLVRLLYHADTSTNVFPSIHVFNSLGAYYAVKNHKKFEAKPGIVWGSFFITISIIASTMFLKQHSVLDVIGGIALAIVLSQLVYARQDKNVLAFSKQLI